MNTSIMTTSLDAKINSIVSVLIRPNQIFREIIEINQNYFITAIAIFTISSFFFVSYTTEESNTLLPINEMGFVWDARYQVQSFGESILWNLLSIALIFYLGMKLGGSNSFRKVFSVMAFAMVPVLMGGIILHVFFMYPPLLVGITGIDKSNPEFVGLFWPLYFAFMPFALWSFILSVKAIMIVDNFGTAKAFGILIISAVVVYFVAWTITLVL